MYNNAWYVGRVAEVHKNGERINVNYIDGDFECNIPLSKGKVILIERGSNSDSWLLGNSVEWKTTKYKRGGASSRGPKSSNIQKGTIIDVVGRDTSIKDTSFQSPFVDYSHLAFCTVKLSTGKEASISYADVVKRIFASRKSICDAALAVKYWPGTEGINKKRTKAKMVRRLRTSSLKDISNLDIRASIENSPIDQVKKRQVKVSTLKRNRFDSKNLQISNQVPHINELSNQKDTDLHYVSNVSKLESDGVGIYEKKAREMEPIIANTMLRALESAESHAGCNLLTQMACILNTVPNSKLAQNLFEFTATGPKSEGTHFRDPNKTELISNYVRTVIEKSYEPNCISAPKIAPMNWDEIEQILSLPISQTDDSIVPCNLYDSWSRVMIHQLGLALQMSSNSLSSLSKIFTNELSHLSASRKMGTQAQPLSSAIIKYGIRKSLKTSVSISLRSWIRHGHWLYGFMNERRRVCKSSDEQRCATEAKCCLNYLGKIISFLARLYCTEENIQFAHANCCYVIVEAIESEFERADYKSLQKANPSMKEKYIARIKLRFLLSLDTEFSRPLQMNMGNMLEISNDLSFVIG